MNDWLLFTIIALLLWGLWGLFPKIASNYIGPKSVLIYEAIGAAFLTIIVLFSVGFKPEIHAKGITFGILGGLAGAIGGLFFLYAISRGKASIVVPITALYPLVTILLAFIILKEPITLKQGIGIALALAAMVLLSL